MIVGREYWFSAAHWLPGHQYCGKMHGHNYKLIVEVAGRRGDMVMDFSDMDKIVEPIIEKLDHGVINDYIEVPTAENIVDWLWLQLLGKMDVWRVVLWENDRSYAMRMKNGDTGRPGQ